MSIRRQYTVHLDEQGRLIIPPGVAERFGLRAGEQTILEENGRELILHRPTTYLERVYLEVTNTCNLNCSTCIRNVWDEPYGWMDAATFERVIQELCAFNPRPLLFFGGFGEPLAHPQTLNMIRAANSAGIRSELISNGTRLDETASRTLLENNVCTLWVSLDGATRQAYLDVRLGDELDGILRNLRRFARLRSEYPDAHTQLGIAIVVMRRNLNELPRLFELGLELGANCFSISNVLAHTQSLRNETLYDQVLNIAPAEQNSLLPWIDLPRLDMLPEVQRALAQVTQTGAEIRIGGFAPLRSGNRCPFIEKNSMSVRWDGKVSPCLPLLHSHDSYLDNRLRRSHAYFVGDVKESSLTAIWYNPAYLELRSRLCTFDFSPCALCNACEMAEQNLEDCFGNQQPACGGCLWAHGLIQCP